MEIHDILIKSTVKIGIPNLFTHGTGYYIDEETIITCFHCIREFNPLKIPIFINNKNGEAIYFESDLSEKYDVALLKTDLKNKHAVHLHGEIEPNYSVTIFGYSDDNPNGASVGLECEGLSFDDSQRELIKFRNGNIRKGHSGSPILSINSGTIVGMIRETNHPNFPFGGYGIPLKTIQECYPDITKLNIQHNLKNNLWQSLNKTHKTGIGIYDQTITNGHFSLFSTDIGIDELFIQPNYKLIKYNNVEELQEIEKTNDIIYDALKILDKIRFLFILGSFGTGKTILTKKLQKHIIENGSQTLFFQCSDLSLIDDYSKFYNLIMALKPKSELLYCFFDGYDELNLLGNDKLEIIGSFLKNLIRLSKEPEIFVILNSRNIHKKEEEVYFYISLQFDELRKEKIEYLVLHEYTNYQIGDYLDSFANAMAKRKQEQRLFLHDIKRLHKNLKTACTNPLFLYCLESAFYERGIRKNYDLYGIYESFVNRTILGKFSDDKYPNNPAIQEISQKYKFFLRKLASEILIKNNKIKFDKEQIYDFYLDKNNESYYIEYNKVSQEIQEIAAEILSEEIRNNISKNRLRENVLSCYFLDCQENNWRIKDNNLLFFLVAAGYYEKLSNILGKYIDYYTKTSYTDNNVIDAEFYDELYESFKYEKRIPLHPLSIEFLFQKIDNLSPNKKEYLWSFIKTLIDNREMLNINAENIRKLDITKLNIDIILLLIFKRINTYSYDEIDLVYFFKRYYWFISAAKIIDRNYLYLAQRFFKHSNIKGVELRRINFDGYNFDYSKLKNVHFIQDKFHETRMNNCEFENVRFTLCDFMNFELDSFLGNVQFSNCIIEKLYIRNPISNDLISFLVFKNCQIKWLEIHSTEKNSTHTINIEFIGSDINSLIIDGTLFKDFILRNCIYTGYFLNEDHVSNHEVINCLRR